METKRRVATAVVAFSIAMGSGHFVQYGPTVNAGLSTLESTTETGIGEKIVAIFGDGTEVESKPIARLPSGAPIFPSAMNETLSPNSVVRRPQPFEAEIEAMISEHDLSAFGLPCAKELSAEKSGFGTARVVFHSNCRSGQVVEFSYAGLDFTEVTDDFGRISIEVPILDGDRTLTVRDPSGEILTSQMPSAVGGQSWRAAINWKEGAGLSIHAYEFGAAFGDPGHVRADRARAAGNSSIGRVLRLGNDNLPQAAIAEVYGVPLLGNVPSGTVELVVEVTVSPANCGRDVVAKVWNPQAAGGFRPVDVSVSMPDCDAIGETLVLKNLIQDLKLAAN